MPLALLDLNSDRGCPAVPPLLQPHCNAVQCSAVVAATFWKTASVSFFASCIILSWDLVECLKPYGGQAKRSNRFSIAQFEF